MNWLDIVLLVILVGSVIGSIRRGLSHEIIGVVAALAGLFGGLWLYGVAGSFLQPYVSSRSVANFCGFLLVFAGALVAGALVSFLVGKFLKAVGLSWLDRMLGAAFGLLRWVVISIAVITAIVAFAPAPEREPPRSVVESRVAPYVLDVARLLTALAPRELKDEFARRYEEVKKIWEKSVPQGAQGLPRSVN